MKNLLKRLKLIIALILAFFGTQIVSNTIFFNSMPTINRSFLASLFNLGRNKTNTSMVNNLQTIEQLPTTALNAIGKGVYAKEDSTENVIYIRITKDAQWEEKKIIMDGKIITIKFPKGSQ